MVRNKALAAGAARWLGELPGLIASLERDWRITVGRPYPDATEAFVAEARPRSVLKLMIPRPAITACSRSAARCSPPPTTFPGPGENYIGLRYSVTHYSVR